MDNADSIVGCNTRFSKGMTLSPDDFVQVARRPAHVLLGFALQYTIMPLAALLVTRCITLPPSIAAGVLLVSCCPGMLRVTVPKALFIYLDSGGTASNLVTLIAKADVALSVAMTSCSTSM
jgi:BASS family bile acid:Na+ symporter